MGTDRCAGEDAVRGRVMAALEASVQAGLLAGVALAACSDTLFRPVTSIDRKSVAVSVPDCM